MHWMCELCLYCSFDCIFFCGNDFFGIFQVYPFFVDALDVRVSMCLQCSFECIFPFEFFFWEQEYPSFVDALDVRVSVYLQCFFECI